MNYGDQVFYWFVSPYSVSFIVDSIILFYDEMNCGNLNKINTYNPKRNWSRSSMQSQSQKFKFLWQRMRSGGFRMHGIVWSPGPDPTGDELTSFLQTPTWWERDLPPPLVSAALKLLVPTQVLIHMELLSTAGGTVQRQILRYWTQNWCQYNNISILKFCCVSSAFKLSQTTKTILQEP